MSRATTDMWGIRFGHRLVIMKMGRRKAEEAFRTLANDLRERNALVMEAEDAFKPYIYLMFYSREDAEEFFSKHKDEKLYQQAKMRLIKEPAHVPSEWLGERPAEA